MKKLGKLFGFNKKKAEEPEATKATAKKGTITAAKKDTKGVKGAQAEKATETKPKKTGWW